MPMLRTMTWSMAPLVSVTLTLTLTLQCPGHVDGAKILLVPPQLSSHVLMMLSIGEELVSRGHEVHAVLGSRYPDLDSVRSAGIRVLDYHVPPDVIFTVSEEWSRLIGSSWFSDKFDNIDSATAANAHVMDRRHSDSGYEDCSVMMADHKFLDAARRIQFDIAVVEPFFIVPCKMLLANYLGLPFVSYTVFVVPFEIGLPALPSFYVSIVPNGIPIPAVDSFSDRVRNLYLMWMTKRFVDGMFTNVSLLRQFAPKLSSWYDLIRQSELFLLDYDHHLHHPMPLLPHVVPVAGCTIKPAKPLSPYFEKLFADSGSGNDGDGGVIVVSFGSMAYHLSSRMIAKLLVGLSKFNQTVIARLPAPDAADGAVPPNVRLTPWLPQLDLIADNRTRLMIGHCGSNGLHEAIFYGIPVLGFPLFAEQQYLCHRAQVLRMGISMDIWNFTVEQFVSNVQEIIHNPSYKQSVLKLSAIYRSQPMFGRQKAAYWIEHVLKHGSHHLKSPAVNMPLYQMFMFDVIGLFFILCVVLLYCCCYCCCGRAGKSSKAVTGSDTQSSDGQNNGRMKLD